ncbi:MAG: glycerol kinase [Verrucomicrobiae bacterium]|nr:glycerol kinase [Verrucomicrobiae bacterium]
MSCVLALDAGTTSVRAIVFDIDGSARAIAQKEIQQIYPKPGWVEHDPREIWTSQMSVAIEALDRAHIHPGDVAAIGITNQRETTIVWDRTTGEPICHAIVWQDRRTASMCDRLRADGCEAMIRERTGLLLDAYFSATKVAWILDHVPGTRERANADKLAFGTVDTWLVWKLTEGKVHVTDVTNASRTMLFNIRTGQWDDELLKLFHVPRSMMPEVRSSSEVYAEVSTALGLRGVRVGGIAGDQQAALFGQMCIVPGLTKNTYGTGCFMLQNIGDQPVTSRNRLLTTIAWRFDGRTQYALEGSVFNAGTVVQWLRDGLGLIRASAEINDLAATVPDNGGAYLVPAFTGLGAPHWNPHARGVLVGLSRGVTKAHIARAALEGIAYQVADVLEAMQADTGKALKELRVDGGASQSHLLLQFQADILGVPVVRPSVSETTALGAAYLAGLAVGFWKDAEEISLQWKVARRFEPMMARDRVQELRDHWRKAVVCAKDWEKQD